MGYYDRDADEGDDEDMPGVDMPVSSRARLRSHGESEGDVQPEGLSHDLERTSKSISALSETITDLYDRLIPILGPELPTEDKKEHRDDRGDDAPIRMIVQGQKSSVNQQNRKLLDLLRRIEL